MQSAPLPEDEPSRLAELQQYTILDSPPDEGFDNLAKLAAHICDTPIALVSFVDAHRQWCQAKVGIDVPEIPRDLAFCAYTILGRDLFIVPDAAQDKRFADNPLVALEAPKIRFYAGMPLVTPTGHALGTLSVIDRAPKQLTDDQMDALRMLGRQVMSRLELKRSQRTLEANQRSLDQAQALAHVGSWEWDIETGAEIWSEELFRIFGYEPCTITPTIETFREAVHPDDRNTVFKAIEDALEQNHPYEVICRIVRPSKELRDVLCRGTVTRDPTGHPRHAVGTVQDITEQTVYEQTLRDSIQRLDLATKSGGIGVWDYHVLENRMVWDKQMHALYGYTPENFPGTHEAWADRLHPADRPYAEASVLAAIEGRGRFDMEFRLALPDQSIRHIKTCAAVLKDERDGTVRMTGISYDVTARKESVQAILEFHSFQKAILFNAPHAVIATSTAGIIQHFNPAAEQLLGYSAEETIGKLTPAVFHNSEEVAARAKIFGAELGIELEPGFEVFVAKARLNLPNQHEWIYVRKDGTRIPVLLSVTAIRDHTGTITGFLGMALDIIERKEAEKKFRQVVESAPSGMLMANQEGVITLVNSQIERWFGYDRQELLGQSLEILLPDRFRSQHPTHRTGFYHNPQARAMGVGRELFGRRKDGSEFPLEIGLSPIKTAQGTQVLAAIVDVTTRKQADEALKQRSLLMELSFESIMVREMDGTIVEWNRGCNQLYGYSTAEAVGTVSHDLLKTEFPIPLATIMAKFVAEGTWNGELRHRTRDGHAVTVNSRWHLFIANQRRLVLETNNDITARKQAEERLKETAEELMWNNLKLQEANQSALAATRAKSDFLATMSHEIRTPMNAIVGMAELLQETPLTPDQANYVGRFSRAAASLMELINAILDLSKIEAGYMALESVPFDLHILADTIADLMAGKAMAKQLELMVLVHPDIPHGVVGDPTRLKQVLVNLVGNAIKFTESGHVMIKVEPAGEPSAAHALRFSVSDTGIGIPLDKLDTIFEPFTQVDSTTTRKYGGTGLGLSISRRIVELMGGRIEVNSTPGAGATFSFVIQLPEAPLLVIQQTGQYIDLNRRHMLVVDDNDTNMMIIREHLLRSGVRLVEATSASAALTLLDEAHRQNNPFDLAILDYHMPGMNGLELAEAIRNRPECTTLPLVMHVSDLQRDEMRRASALGIRSYLYKPLSRRRLMESLAVALNQAPPKSVQQKSEVRPEQSILPPYRILLVEDLEDNRDVVSLFLKETPYQLDMAENGAVGLNKFKQGTYDLVFMDMQMPVMDGLEATAAIRQWEREQQRKPTPIIALTANAFKEESDKSLAAGCTAHVTKPIMKKTLLSTITHYAMGPADKAA